MTYWPGPRGNTPHDPRWGDPDAATRAVPAFDRPPAAGWPTAPSPPVHPTSPGPPQSPGPRRRPTLLALAAVVILAGAIVAYLRVSGVEENTNTTASSTATQPAPTNPGQPSSSAPPPTALPTSVPDPATSAAAQTVLGYFAALRGGDAAKALSYAKSTPTDTSLLTNEVLAKQIAAWPITDVRIDSMSGDEETAAFVLMNVSVTFGGTVRTGELALHRNTQNGWSLEAVASEYQPAPGRVAETLLVFGQPMRTGSPFTVFPGFVEVTSSNPLIQVVSNDYPVLPNWPRLRADGFETDVDLNTAGKSAIYAALTGSFAACETSNLIAPPGCPVKLNADDAVDGTVSWGRAEFGTPSIELHQDLMVHTMSSGSIPVTYQSVDGEHITMTQEVSFKKQFDIASGSPVPVG